MQQKTMKDRILRVRPRFEVKIRTYCHPEGFDDVDFLKIFEVLYNECSNAGTQCRYYERERSDSSSTCENTLTKVEQGQNAYRHAHPVVIHK